MHSNYAPIFALALFVFLLLNSAIDGQQRIDRNKESPKFIPGEPPRFIPGHQANFVRVPKTITANEEKGCIHGPKPRLDVQRCQDLGTGYWLKAYCQNGSTEIFHSIDGTQDWFCQFCQCQSTCAQKCSEQCFVTSDATVLTVFYECKLLASAATTNFGNNNQNGIGICAMNILMAIGGILVGIFMPKMLIEFPCCRQHFKIVAQENVVAKSPAKQSVVYNF